MVSEGVWVAWLTAHGKLQEAFRENTSAVSTAKAGEQGREQIHVWKEKFGRSTE